MNAEFATLKSELEEAKKESEQHASASKEVDVLRESVAAKDNLINELEMRVSSPVKRSAAPIDQQSSAQADIQVEDQAENKREVLETEEEVVIMEEVTESEEEMDDIDEESITREVYSFVASHSCRTQNVL